MLPHIFKPNIENLRQIVESFAFPRMVGSEGEKRVFDAIYHQLKPFGLALTSENVKFEGESFNYIKKIQATLSFLLIGLVLTLFLGFYLASLIIAGLILGSVILKYILKLPPNAVQSTKNLIGERMGTKRKEFEAKNALILLIAHYDSMGWRFFGIFFNRLYQLILPLNIIIPLFTVPIFIVYMVNGPSAMLFTFGGIIAGGAIIAAVGNYMDALNKKENISPGATDNATGMATLIALAKRLHESSTALDWCDVRLLFTGAEEMGWWGAKQYVKDHATEFSEYAKVFVINVDPIYDKLALMTRFSSGKHQKKDDPMSELDELFLHHASQLKIPLAKFDGGTQFGGDHIPFHAAGFETSCLCSLPYDFIHSPADSKEKVNIQQVQNALELLFNVILSIEQQVKSKMGR